MTAEAEGALAATVAFASDYGHQDPFVGLCHLAIGRVGAALGARIDVVDLCHTLPAYDVRAGAALLADALPWIPAGSVVLAVVDPGVGTDRAGVVVRVGDPGGDASAGGSERDPAGPGGVGPLYLVGPDNGLLTAAAGDRAQLAWRIPPLSRPQRVAGEPVAATFDGRDVFAPVAGRLAVDADAALGTLEPIGVDALVGQRLPGADLAAGRIAAEVVRVDGFGNLLLSAGASAIEQAGWRPGQRVTVTIADAAFDAVVVRAFDELGDGGLGVLGDAFGRLQLAVDRGSAASQLGVAVGTQVTVAGGREGAGRTRASAGSEENPR